jgi:chemotaxis protein CheD
MSEVRVPVLIGEAKVAGPGNVLFTIGLGSCVAITLFDPEVRVGGLAHAMLPDPANGRRNTPATRFASTAVPTLLEMMTAAGATPARVHARLAGGASMFEALLNEKGRRLGMRNVEAAREALARAGIDLGGEDVGGSHGRSVYLRTVDGVVTITSVSHANVVL